jgi:hypothetical protein
VSTAGPDSHPDVLENKSHRGQLDHLGDLATFWLYRNDRQIKEVSYQPQSRLPGRPADRASHRERTTAGTREAGQQYLVFLLSGSDDSETVRLAQSISNNIVSASRMPWAWTLGQRYTSLAKLTAPGVRATSDLAS